MLIVGIDTSGKHGGIALARSDDGRFTLLEETEIAGGTFSAQLIPQLASLLARHGDGKHDVDGIAVASGPGSFTGLRVGLAAVKGLAEILHIPIAAISLLEAVALAAHDGGDVLTVLDAGRGEFYVGTYRVTGDHGTLKRPEELLSGEELVARAANGTVVVTPEQAVAQLLEASTVRMVERPGAAMIAEIGARKLRDGIVVSPEELDVNYIRRSDAEIAKKT
ncbi:MAG: tRNA (adenosine(37)-N6)-threonylcarbamoyltransferase complex dimerization subunit type 1 TsaB [Acidobacteria bacterium]|nr:tRNA (adenosine(37)-N6)-threonylcarbamoyltransferase complex dimerization subunit type 1 TsaB [Acidobacteriota bacterium]